MADKEAHPITSSPDAQARLQAAIAARDPVAPEKEPEAAADPDKPADAVQTDKPPVDPPKPEAEAKSKPGDLAAALAEKHASAKRSKSLQVELDRIKAENESLKSKSSAAPDPAKYVSREEIAADPLRFLLGLNLDQARGQQMAEDLFYLTSPTSDPAKRAAAMARSASYKAEDAITKQQREWQAQQEQHRAWVAQQDKERAVIAHQSYVMAQLPQVSAETHPLTKVWAEEAPAETAKILTAMQVAWHEDHGGKEPLPLSDLLDGFEEQLSKDPIGRKLKAVPRQAPAKAAEKKSEPVGLTDQAGSTKAPKPLKDMTAEERLAYATDQMEKARRVQQ